MSLALVETEIKRFLKSDVPEVLCIRGKWGVGKTFAWRKLFQAALDEGGLKDKAYAYVSLFGVESMDDFKYAIFENTCAITAPARGQSAQTITNYGLGSRIRPFVDAVASFVNRKGVADLVFKSAFNAVRKQIVCIDDLDRASKKIDVRDVVGLASMLKEERKCRIVFLLNEEQIDNRLDFEVQLEKVADVIIDFRLTPHESISIGLDHSLDSSKRIEKYIVLLGITNIRIIKRLERLSALLFEQIDSYPEFVKEQAATTLALATWSVFQPLEAPPTSFIRTYNSISLSMRHVKDKLDPQTAKYADLLEHYPYAATDDFDEAIIDGVERGYFDFALVRARADVLAAQSEKGASRFEKAWQDKYHGSLGVSDDDFLDELFDASLAEAKVISPLNMNSAILMLRENGRGEKADQLIESYIDQRIPEGRRFFDLSNHIFTSTDRPDAVLTKRFRETYETFADERDPLSTLIGLAENRNWSNEDVFLFAALSSEELESMIESLEGDNLNRGIDTLLTMGRSGVHGADHLSAALNDALRRIASKSPLRARRLSRFDITPEKDD